MAMPNHERMSSVDTAWLRMDSPGSSMMIVGVSATATPVRLDDFRRMLEHRLLCFGRFRQRAVGDALGASWVEDESFDLDAHLKVVTLPAPAGKAELEALAAELASTSLDPRRPLWQFHFVPHYLGGSAWVMRVHHCYADGIAMVRVLLSMTEQDPAPALAPRATARRGEGRATRRRRRAADPELGRATRAAGGRHRRERAGGRREAARGRHPPAVPPGSPGRGRGAGRRHGSASSPGS